MQIQAEVARPRVALVSRRRPPLHPHSTPCLGLALTRAVASPGPVPWPRPDLCLGGACGAHACLGGACLPGGARASHDSALSTRQDLVGSFLRGGKEQLRLLPQALARPAPRPAPRPAASSLAGAARHICHRQLETSHRTRTPPPMRRRRRISTPLSSTATSPRGRSRPSRTRWRSRSSRCRRCSTASTATTSTRAQTARPRRLRSRSSCESAQPRLPPPRVQTRRTRTGRPCGRRVEGSRLASRAHPRLTRRRMGLAGYRAGHTARAAHPEHGCRSPDSLPHAGSPPTL